VTPRASVLLPAFDAAATLPACLRSIQRQSEPRWECIVVDDGSRDATAAVARSFAARDPRFRVLSTPHRGIVHALAAGLERARAPFVARMDADDWMHRERLALQLAALERDPGLAAVGCHVRVFPRAGLRPGLRAYEAWLRGVDSPATLRREAFVECPLPHPTLMARREALAAFGYRDLGWPEDYDLLLRWLAAGLEVGVVPRRLLGWRDGPGRLWRTAAAYTPARFTACKAAHLATGLLARSERYVLWGYGATGRALRRALAAHGRHPSHVVEVHPRRLGQRIHGAPVVPPEALRHLRTVPVVASVAGPTPRAEIRATLTALGFRECRDFLCTA
jgi:glycosyltransferase involved in cell wall biosynthesis